MKNDPIAQTIARLRDTAVAALTDLKAKEIVVLEVSKLTSIADYLVIACGTSSRHLNALAAQVNEQAKTLGYAPIGVEGEPASGWILIDLGDVIVHVMTREARDYYQLEKLWDPNWGQHKPTA